MKGNKMKKLFIVFVMSLFVASASFAQINKNWDGTKPEVYKGSKNFIFMYSPFVSANFGGNFAGSHSSYVDSLRSDVNNLFGVGFQYYVTNEIAIAAGFNMTTGSYEPTLAAPRTLKQSITRIGFSVDGNYHFKSLYGVTPYVGVNVNYGTLSSTADETNSLGESKLESVGNSFGAGINFGFDWYFTPGLSLGGKYTLGYVANSAPEFTARGTNGVSTTWKGPKTSSFGTGIASIMLNVHL